MKKKVLLVISFILVLGLGILLGTEFSKSNLYEEEDYVPEVTHKNMLSMMLEQNAGVGDYSLETRSSWPTKEDGYVFNPTLSKCEKGSKLRWDDENNVVVMVGTTSDKCYAYFDKYNAITINNSSATVSGNSIIITIDAISGDGEISKYYYSKDNGLSYIDSTSNTYKFSNLANGTYKIKYYVEDVNGKTSEIISEDISIESVTLAGWVKLQYTGAQGENNLYYHDSTLANGAGDNSYRYAGSSATTNNYVCFGSDADTCPNDNLYRIIGAFGNQIKLIKWDYANSDLLGEDGDYCSSTTFKTSSYSEYKGAKETINVYYWNSNGTNVWSESKLNTINLNTNFIVNIGEKWSDKISETNWIVGGNKYDNIINATVTTSYKNEIINPAENAIYTAKIGLMYTSDYGFAAGSSAWKTILYMYDFGDPVTSINWMYTGIWGWTIVRASNLDDYAFAYAYSSGLVRNYCKVKNAGGVQPTFYLNSDVEYSSGTGTKNDPIRIKID